ncbi:hypothetical protein D623_10019314 [Myotis brandtii]|uniref:Uncharacterized protein n=1 Tax=Myotis brandtii TaxID=109478 RepID=S7NGJ3_MYOBR|nr:hypothetical protein D623_10019314 [Myotis brandtii]
MCRLLSPAPGSGLSPPQARAQPPPHAGLTPTRCALRGSVGGEAPRGRGRGSLLGSSRAADSLSSEAFSAPPMPPPRLPRVGTSEERRRTVTATPQVRDRQGEGWRL